MWSGHSLSAALDFSLPSADPEGGGTSASGHHDPHWAVGEQTGSMVVVSGLGTK